MLPRFKAASIGSVNSTAGGSISTERSTYSTTSSESSDPTTSPAACNPVSVSPEKEKRPYNGSEYFYIGRQEAFYKSVGTYIKTILQIPNIIHTKLKIY